jgi:hypothetical protein
MKATLIFLLCVRSFGQMVGLASPGPGTAHSTGGGGGGGGGTVPVLLGHTGLPSYTAAAGVGTTPAISAANGNGDCTGASLIAILATDHGSSTNSTTDTIGDSVNGNTYSHGANWSWTGVGSVAIWYKLNPATASSMTFHGSGSDNTIFVRCYSGVSTSGNPQSETGHGWCAATTCQAGTLTPAENNDLILAGVGLFNAGPIAINQGFTILDQNNADTGAFADLIQTGGAAAVNPTFSAPSSLISSVMMVFHHQ